MGDSKGAQSRFCIDCGKRKIGQNKNNSLSPSSSNHPAASLQKICILTLRVMAMLLLIAILVDSGVILARAMEIMLVMIWATARNILPRLAGAQLGFASTIIADVLIALSLFKSARALESLVRCLANRQTASTSTGRNIEKKEKETEKRKEKGKRQCTWSPASSLSPSHPVRRFTSHKRTLL
jgi:hypothetical protein